MDAQTKLQRLKRRIELACQSANRSTSEVTLLAVSKTFPAEDIEKFALAGQQSFGENYLQEAVKKITQLAESPNCPALQWHFIGHIQSNKCKAIANQFSWVQTLDRPKIAQRLSNLRTQAKPLNVLIQVNLDADPNKGGVDEDGACALLEQLLTLPNLTPRGLMTILAKSSVS